MCGGDAALDVDDGTTPPMTVGNCIKTFLASSSVLQRRVRGTKVSSFGLDHCKPAPEPTTGN
jgi:hypothetical protein